MQRSDPDANDDRSTDNEDQAPYAAHLFTIGTILGDPEQSPAMPGRSSSSPKCAVITPEGDHKLAFCSTIASVSAVQNAQATVRLPSVR